MIGVEGDAMEHQAEYERLVRAARAGEFVHYARLAKMLGNQAHDYWSRGALSSL